MAIISFLRQHLLDSLVVLGYLAFVLYLGRASSKTTHNEEAALPREFVDVFVKRRGARARSSALRAPVAQS